MTKLLAYIVTNGNTQTAVERYKAIIRPKLRARILPAQRGEAAIAIEGLNRMIRMAKPTSIRAASHHADAGRHSIALECGASSRL